MTVGVVVVLAFIFPQVISSSSSIKETKSISYCCNTNNKRVIIGHLDLWYKGYKDNKPLLTTHFNRHSLRILWGKPSKMSQRAKLLTSIDSVHLIGRPFHPFSNTVNQNCCIDPVIPIVRLINSLFLFRPGLRTRSSKRLRNSDFGMSNSISSNRRQMLLLRILQTELVPCHGVLP